MQRAEIVQSRRTKLFRGDGRLRDILRGVVREGEEGRGRSGEGGVEKQKSFCQVCVCQARWLCPESACVGDGLLALRDQTCAQALSPPFLQAPSPATPSL